MDTYKKIIAHLTGFRARPDKVIRDLFPKFHKKVLEKFGTFSVKNAYMYLHPDAGTCLECSQPTAFNGFVGGFAPYCSRTCAWSSTGRQNSRRATCLDRYGVTHVSKDKEIHARKMATCRMNFGTDYPMQNRKLFDQAQRTSSLVKPVVLNGKTIWTRGYEQQVIKRLLDKGFAKQEIRPPKRSYRYKDSEGNTRRYHPDLCVRDYVVEVKSPYTAGLTPGSSPELFKTLRRKAKSVIHSGDNFVMIVADKQGQFLAVSTGVPSKVNLRHRLASNLA